jgi:hypothetical protein
MSAQNGGGNGVNLVKRPNGDTDQKNRAEPAFSPDGKSIAFIKRRLGLERLLFDGFERDHQETSGAAVT